MSAAAVERAATQLTDDFTEPRGLYCLCDKIVITQRMSTLDGADVEMPTTGSTLSSRKGPAREVAHRQDQQADALLEGAPRGLPRLTGQAGPRTPTGS